MVAEKKSDVLTSKLEEDHLLTNAYAEDIIMELKKYSELQKKAEKAGRDIVSAKGGANTGVKSSKSKSSSFQRS